jgi:hypothetical protein
MSFLDGANTIAGAGSKPVSGGEATILTSFSTVGLHVITVDYQDGSDFLPSSDQLDELVEAHTTTALSSSTDSVVSTGQVTFTATVAPVSASGNPAGDVSFYDGGALIGMETLDSSEVAALTLNADVLALGANDITAAYAGLDGFLASTSAGVSVTVTPPVSGVPEPATWAMLILGVGMIGSEGRRRRKCVEA